MLKNFYQKFNKLGAGQKSAIAFMFASLIQQGISFLITPLFTRILSTEEFGVVTVYNSWVEMIGTVAMLSLSSGIFNVGMVDFEDERDSFTSALLGLSNVATILTMILFLAGSILFPSVISMPKSLYILMLIYFIFYPATRFWTARQRYEYKYKKLTIITILSAILSPLVGLIAVLSLNGNLGVVRLWGTNSVIIIVGIIFYIRTVQKCPQIIDKNIWVYALKFSIPLLPHYMAMHILATSDRVMIQSMIGNAEAGLYGLAYTASMIICVAWTAIQGSLTPYVYEQLKKDELDKIAPVAIPCIVLFSVLCFVVVLVAPEFMLVLGGQKYQASTMVIPPLIAAVLFMEMYNLFSMIEFYHKKTLKIMFATLLAAVINVVMNYFAIKHFGYVAAAYTTLICYIIYCIFHYLNMKSIEPRKIYHGAFLVVYSIIYVLACLLCLPLYKHTLVRFAILVLIVIILLINRNKIIKLINRKNG